MQNSMKRRFTALLAAVMLCSVVVSCSPKEKTPSGTSSKGSSVSSQSDVSTDVSDNSSEGTSQITGGSSMSNSSSLSTSKKPIASTSSTKTSSIDVPSKPAGPYDVTKDNFYNKKNIYCTWLNVWDGATEGWWNEESSSGTKIIYKGVNSTTSALNWSDPDLQQFYLNEVKAAGINAVVMDLTNGIRWGDSCEAIRDYVYKNGMKYSAAINSGELEDFESKARSIYEYYANPDLEKGGAYLYKNGKPVLVAYVGTSFWDGALNQGKPGTEYASKFTIMWASGEDSRADKWGWQVPAKDGPQASKDSMFVTSAINWTAPAWSMTGWRKNLAYLDYCFLIAKKHNPKFVIVNSYDDMRERHGWIKADTTKVSFNYNQLAIDSLTKDNQGTPGMIMRDVYGKVSTDAYYNRTSAWIKGTATAYNKGGIIKDGAYLVKNASTGKGITSENPTTYNPQNGALPIDRTNDKVGVQAYQKSEPGYQQYYFFYHLGNNEYRIVRICVGLSLDDDYGNVKVNYDSAANSQRWKLEKVGGNYVFVNKATGMAMNVASANANITTAKLNISDQKQQWSLTSIALMD